MTSRRASLKHFGGDGVHGARVDVLPPSDQLVAAGDRACEWLGEQRKALCHSDGNDVMDLVHRYEADRGPQLPPWGQAPHSAAQVSQAARAHLCPSVWQVVGPVRWFQRGAAD